MSKAKTTKAATATAEPIPTIDDLNVWNELLARDEDYPAKFKAATADVEFFDLLQELPESVWENRFLIYLYRLDPVIRNKSGEKSYLCKVAYPIDEEWIRKNYGGGKYHLYLKDARDTLKETKPRFEGTPKFEEGQTVGNSGTPAVATATAPAENHQSEVAQILDATQKASQAQVEMMQSGMERALDLQNKVVEKSMGLNQPDAKQGIGDKLLEALLPRLLTPPDPMAQLAPMLALIEKLTPKPNPEHEQREMGGQLELVKDIFGVDSLRDLGGFLKGREPKVDPAPWWSAPAVSFVEKLPGILAQVAEMQRDAYERAIHLRTIQGMQPGQQLPPAPPRPQPQPQTVPPAQTAPPPNGQVTAETIQQAFPAMINIIAGSFDQNRSGDFAAETIDFQFPGVMQEVAPLLGNQEKLSEFVAGVPILAQRSAAPEWQEFQNDFVGYVTESYGESPAPGGEPADGPKAVAANGAA